MKKIIVVFVLVILLILIYGCDQQNPTSSTENFRTGTAGLTISFISNNPPAKVYIRSSEINTVKVGLDLRNQGAADIKSGNLILSGYDPTIISWPSSQGLPALEGRNAFNPVGGFASTEFSGVVNTAALGEAYSPTIMATACYDYSTIAEMSVCIDPDPFVTKPRACNPSNTISGSGQGGPVGISKVDVQPTQGRSIFQVFFKNFGKGDVFVSKQGTTKCLPKGGGIDERAELNLVYVRKVKVGNKDITGSCRGTQAGIVRLSDGVGFIYCTYDAAGSDAFQTVLSIEIGYSYRITATRSIQFVKLP